MSTKKVKELWWEDDNLNIMFDNNEAIVFKGAYIKDINFQIENNVIKINRTYYLQDENNEL
ncbi:MAG: hypothetical protein ACOYLO_00735 [Ferruginibacter sp.]